MTPKERLIRYLKEKGIGQTAFEANAGLARGVLAKRTGFNDESLNKIMAACPDLDICWLLTGHGSKESVPNAEQHGTTEDGIPFYDHAIACGMPADFNAVIENGKADGRIVLPNLHGDFALVARGDSMLDTQRPERSIPADSIVVLKIINDISFIRWGETYALATRDGFLIKKIMPGGGNSIECHSFNAEAFPPFTILKSEIIGIARVLAVINYRLY